MKIGDEFVVNGQKYIVHSEHGTGGSAGYSLIHGDTARWSKMHAGYVKWNGGVMVSASILCGAKLTNPIPEERPGAVTDVTCDKCQNVILTRSASHKR